MVQQTGSASKDSAEQTTCDVKECSRERLYPSTHCPEHPLEVYPTSSGKPALDLVEIANIAKKASVADQHWTPDSLSKSGQKRYWCKDICPRFQVQHPRCQHDLLVLHVMKRTKTSSALIMCRHDTLSKKVMRATKTHLYQNNVSRLHHNGFRTYTQTLPGYLRNCTICKLHLDCTGIVEKLLEG